MLIGRAHPRQQGPGLFNCGHPRTPENSTTGYLHKNGKRYPQCRLCHRIRWIARTVYRQLERWKTGKLTQDEKRLRRCM